MCYISIYVCIWLAECVSNTLPAQVLFNESRHVDVLYCLFERIYRFIFVHIILHSFDMDVAR